MGENNDNVGAVVFCHPYVSFRQNQEDFCLVSIMLNHQMIIKTVSELGTASRK